ncbi:26S proteasome non-ATPase regulatory subunit 9 [Borealophlyctis nickersoniae]|nr:26S proteasome non-ATPase regulatory subunit 9 [Borealophlyctis nickersoniae]
MTGLRNDHKAKMAEIETALHAVHAQAKQESGLEGSRRSEDVPFAKVDGVDPEGPGAEAGIKRGDFIMRFGPVDATKQLKDIADVVNANENKPVRVLVKREEQIMTLIVTPHRWSGRGLLGCHLVPV